MMLIGGSSIRNGTMTVGDLLMYLSFTALMTMPIVQLASIGTQLTEAFAGLDRIREIRRMATEDQEDAGSRTARRCPRAKSSSTIVSFEYNAGRAGAEARVVPLAGRIDDGARRLERLRQEHADQPRDDLQPSRISGRVLVDGHDLTTVRLRDYRSHLGVVLQDNFLFDGTIAENIKYARPHATLDEIKAVSRIAHCDEFIEAFEKQYDTIVGERGVRLSGGQRQRVAIARAILANPRILILDEATSSLDSESEALIQDGLRSLRQGRTTFVIAHRLSTIRSADQILVLEDGEIVERGHARAACRPGRTVPAALRQAIPVRARPFHQPRRGLHARARGRRCDLRLPAQAPRCRKSRFFGGVSLLCRHSDRGPAANRIGWTAAPGLAGDLSRTRRASDRRGAERYVRLAAPRDADRHDRAAPSRISPTRSSDRLGCRGNEARWPRERPHRESHGSPVDPRSRKRQSWSSPCAAFDRHARPGQ